MPLKVEISGRLSRAPSQASPSSSGVTATGAKAVAGLPWKKPKPLASSVTITLRSDTSFRMVTSLMCLRAASGEMPIGTSSMITPISPSKSMPQASSASSISSVGPTKESEPPWYISGSVQKLGGISTPRALRTSSTCTT